ncbi:hypothetical protein BJX65DRAFT_133978 [Aspergillus insuetus]
MVFVTSTFHLLFIRQLLVVLSSASTQHSIYHSFTVTGRRRILERVATYRRPLISTTIKKKKSYGKSDVIDSTQADKVLVWYWTGFCVL